MPMLSPQAKKILQFAADNAFWVFLVLMIVLGSTISTPFIR